MRPQPTMPMRITSDNLRSAIDSRDYVAGVDWQLSGRQSQRIEKRHRARAECVEHCAAGGEAVRDPIRLAVAFERDAPFAAADIDLDARVRHPLELLDKVA